ncbi:glycosyltransferase family 2 protein [Desulfovibrio sp. ZJ369]|uniref:glycosyltransferase family 2 protein n=1 Tax=Desulfovibrio sp. ZJ369 TaxID=2709793 RepID=UPI001F14C818|nr:glycosyltransferase family 2 protein [Desulfovibrio sp. ZJ369]
MKNPHDVCGEGMLPEDLEPREYEDDVPLLLSLVIPVCNEEDAIPVFLKKINEVFENQKAILLEMVFVNDGSQDRTLKCLLEQQKKDARIVIIDLSRNFGKEAALSAGLKFAGGRVVVPLDVDLQDPPELIPVMLEEWRKGYEVVLARRVKRQEDSWAKRVSAGCFYRIHNTFAMQKLPENVGDFRLMDKSVVDALNSLPESCRFMKGIFAWVGFRRTCIDYARPARVAGHTKFSAWRLWNFALEGITSFSTIPLRIWLYLGASIAFLDFCYGLFILMRTLIFGVDVPGYASLLVTMLFLGGLQLIGIGILGEYLGRNYLESKHRPIFLVRKIYREQKGA